jgi:hypothetical protein
MLENIFLKLTRNRRVQDELAILRGLDLIAKGYNDAKTISYVRNVTHQHSKSQSIALGPKRPRRRHGRHNQKE